MSASDFLNGEITSQHLANTGKDPEDDGDDTPDCAKKTKLNCVEKTKQYCENNSKRICLAVPMTDPKTGATRTPTCP